MFEGLGRISETNSLGGEVNDFSASTVQAKFPTFKPNDSEEPIELSAPESTVTVSSSTPNPLTSSMTSTTSVTTAGSMATATASASASTIAVGITVGAAITGVVATAITATAAVLFMARIQEEYAYVYADVSTMTIEYSLEVEYNKAGTLYAELSTGDQIIEIQQYELTERVEEQDDDFHEEEVERSGKDEGYPYLDYMWGKFGGESDASLLLDTPYDLEIYYLNDENRAPVYRKTGIILSVNVYVDNFFWTSETGSKSILYSYDVYYREPVSLGHNFITNTGESIRLYDNDISLAPDLGEEPNENGYYMTSVEGVYESDVDFEDYIFEVLDLSTYKTIYQSSTFISTSPVTYLIDNYQWGVDVDSKDLYFSYDIYFQKIMTLCHYLLTPDGEMIDIENKVELSADKARPAPNMDGFYFFQVSVVYHTEEEFSGYTFMISDESEEESIPLFKSEPEISMILPDLVVNDFQWSSNLDAMDIIYSYTIRYRVGTIINNYLVTEKGELLDLEKTLVLTMDSAAASPDEDGYYSMSVEGNYLASADFKGYSFRVVAGDSDSAVTVFESDSVIETSTSVSVSLGDGQLVTLESERLALHVDIPIEFSYLTQDDNAMLLLSIFRTDLGDMETIEGDEITLNEEEATLKNGVYTKQYDRYFHGLDSNMPYTLQIKLYKFSSESESVIYRYDFVLAPEGEIIPYLQLTDYRTIHSGGSIVESSYVGEEGYTYMDFEFSNNGIEGASYYLAVYNSSGNQIGDTIQLSLEDYDSYTDAAFVVFDENAQVGDSAEIETLCRKAGESSFITLSRHTIYFK